MTARFLPLIVLGLCAVGAMFLVEGFVREVLMRPLLYMAWVGELLIRSLPHGLYWSLFTLGVFYFGIRRLAFVRRRAAGPVRTAAATGPVAQWQRKLQRGRSLSYGQWTLARDLRKLTLDILYSEHIPDPGEESEDVSLQDAGLPAHFATYFDSKVESQDMGLARVWDRIPFLARPVQSSSALYPEPEEIVAYLEERMMTQDTQA